LNRETWNVQEILNRCDRMAKQIAEIYPYEGGKDLSDDVKDDDIIVLNTPNVNARAMYINPQCIEVMAGSTMKAYRQNDMKSMRTLYRDMVERGVLFEDLNGQVSFDKNFRFSDLNTAAQFLMHRGGDNTGSWTREDGTAFLQKKEPAAAPKKPEPQKKQKQESPVKKDATGQKRKKNRAASKRTPKKQSEQKPAQNKQENKPKPAKKQEHKAPAKHTKPQAKKQETKPQTQPVKQAPVKKAEPEKAKVEVRKYSKKDQAHAGLKPQKVTAEEKKIQSQPGFFRSLFGKKPKS
jgi:hypothetical protein